MSKKLISMVGLSFISAAFLMSSAFANGTRTCQTVSMDFAEKAVFHYSGDKQLTLEAVDLYMGMVGDVNAKPFLAEVKCETSAENIATCSAHSIDGDLYTITLTTQRTTGETQATIEESLSTGSTGSLPPRSLRCGPAISEGTQE